MEGISTGLIDLGLVKPLEIQALAEHIHHNIHISAELVRRHSGVGLGLKRDDGAAHQVQPQADPLVGIPNTGNFSKSQICAVPHCKAQQRHD